MKKFLAILLVLVMVMGIAPMAMAATVNESESNDSYSTADTFALNSTVRGKMEDYDDADYYKIIASTNGKLSITFNHIYSGKDNSWYVTIYYYANNVYNELSNTSISLRDSESVTLPMVGSVANGVYYIKVTNGFYEPVGVEYSIKNTFVSSNYIERETNETYATSTVMSTDKEYIGTMSRHNDCDYYKLTAPSNGKLSFTFNHTYSDNNNSWYVTIYYYTNNTYNELSNASIGMRDSESITLPTVGTVANGVYYIKVTNGFYEPVGVEYSIENSFIPTENFEKEINNTYTNATVTNLGVEMGGCINSSEDIDLFKIVSTSTQSIPVIFNHKYEDKGGYWYICIYKYSDGKYTELKEDSVYRDHTTESKEIYSISAEKNGVYYIKIENGFYDAIGSDYSFVAGTKTSTIHTVTYNANGGSVSPSSANVVSGNSVILPTPTKSYTISYYANGGSGAPSSQKINVTCKGWSTSSATSASYSCGASYKPTANTTLYAVWNTSANANLSQTKPSRSGYTFLGWSTNSNATSVSYAAGNGVTVSGNVSLYAVWQKNQIQEPEQPQIPQIEYKTIFMNYKDTYKITVEGFTATRFVSEDDSIVSVDSEGNVRSNSTGSSDIYVYDSNGDVRVVYTFEVEYTFWQWIIVILLFGWIWY
ncbi:MAG: InlB B-repeat-containing protein [Clostridia bacterium]|nr:InlB B-repeat-containing protein [Clostridia bacterium]